MKKLKIAVTGGIGSGKSEVCKIFENENIPTLQADDLAKQLYITNDNLKKEIIKEFGDEAYSGNEINRKYLSEHVFNDPDKLEMINGIVHPFVIDEIFKWMDKELISENMVVVEAALIFEAGMAKMFDFIITLTANDKNKIERIKRRSGLPEVEIIKRMDSQMPDEVKSKHSDFTITNDDSLEELKSKTLFIINLLKQYI
ncbi:MAG: dephospho-CoA kinase [Melioribacteraceae bacterium]|nr:dephospho-CoA kinase [Melioribacteraceae bacterium]MCF8354389.1 dephospho-CoA kinase [Melioribacteraceae bacterium]MCF8393014.1 dephospho-CoA kinase [Melioribacteraceae bacterium]MCF8417243.1 dephospho-CoA kinase [Melioribacteraceae bacterium]